MKKILSLILMSLVLLSSMVIAQSSNTKEMPPFTIAVGDTSPASDVIIAADVAKTLKNNGYSTNVGATKLFSEVDGLSLNYKVTLVIYEGETKIIVGANSPSSHVIFATDLVQVLKELNVDTDTVMISSEVKYSNLKMLFESAQECYDSDNGRKYYQTGSITEYGIKVEDYCTGSYSLKELYCENGRSKEEIVNCNNGCDNGKCFYPGFFMSANKNSYSEDEVIYLTLNPAQYLKDDVKIDLYIQGPNDEDGTHVQKLVLDGKETFKIIANKNSGFYEEGSYLLLLCDGGAECEGGVNTNSIAVDFESNKVCPTLYDPVCCNIYGNEETVSNDCSCSAKGGDVLFKGGCDAIYTETVKCVFQNSDDEQQCYSTDSKYRCEGEDTCTVDVKGEKGKKITWKSTCGGYEYTQIDGDNDYAYFDCGISILEKPDLIVKNLKYNKVNSGLSTIDFDVVNNGLWDVNSWFAIAVYIDGELYDHTLYNGQKIGTSTNSNDYVDPIQPGERIHKSLSNYYWLNGNKHKITIIADKFEANNEDNPLFEGFRDNMVDESNENNNVVSIYINEPIVEHEIDLDNYPKLFVKNGQFNGHIVVGDSAPASDVVAAVDIATSIKKYLEDEDYHNIGIGTAKLSSEISDPLNMNLISVGSLCDNPVSAQLMGNPYICTKYFEKGDGLIKLYSYNGYVQLLVTGYSDKETRVAAKTLANWEQNDLEGTEIWIKDSGIISYEEPTIITIPAEETQEIPTMIVTTSPSVTETVSVSLNSCNGCLSDEICLPFGTRLVESGMPKYCDINKKLVSQKDKEESCQNNYECGTNQCNDGICGSLSEDLKETKGLLKKIIDWFGKIFD